MCDWLLYHKLSRLASVVRLTTDGGKRHSFNRFLLQRHSDQEQIDSWNNFLKSFYSGLSSGSGPRRLLLCLPQSLEFVDNPTSRPVISEVELVFDIVAFLISPALGRCCLLLYWTGLLGKQASAVEPMSSCLGWQTSHISLGTCPPGKWLTLSEFQFWFSQTQICCC